MVTIKVDVELEECLTNVAAYEIYDACDDEQALFDEGASRDLEEFDITTIKKHYLKWISKLSPEGFIRAMNQMLKTREESL